MLSLPLIDLAAGLQHPLNGQLEVRPLGMVLWSELQDFLKSEVGVDEMLDKDKMK